MEIKYNGFPVTSKVRERLGKSITAYLSMEVDVVQKMFGLVSIRGRYPLTNINFCEAMRLASDFGVGKGIMSHLIYGAEYDTMLQWGANRIYDIVGHLCEWTQEQEGCDEWRVLRGGSFYNTDIGNPACKREGIRKWGFGSNWGFRAALYIP